ncbi:MAG: class I SAM-dependent methyltransferase [Planctomycetes bacterium]|nr:class I SAM-dependent methyltransferase [Planctomycetota bacterium]
MSISHKEQDSVPHGNAVAVVTNTQNSILRNEAAVIKTKLDQIVVAPKHILYFGSGGVDLRCASSPDKKGHQVDFSTIDRRTGAGNLSRKQLFPKAIGATSKTVVDATAGFGVDSAMLALMGFTVVGVEQSSILSVLLRDGIRRALKDKELSQALGDRLSFVEANSVAHLHNMDKPDVVYLDPMFPPKRKKSALPQGSIQLLQQLVGFDTHEKTNTLFMSAKQVAKKRVVVKRPNYAPLFSENPVAIHKGKLVRYEVYKPSS